MRIREEKEMVTMSVNDFSKQMIVARQMRAPWKMDLKVHIRKVFADISLPS